MSRPDAARQPDHDRWRRARGTDRRDRLRRGRRDGAPARGARARSAGARAAPTVPTRRTSDRTSLYKDGPFWRWLGRARACCPPTPACRWPASAAAGRARSGAPRRSGRCRAVLRLRGREAPVDLDFRTWAAGHTDERTAAMLSAAAGVYTFHHDPGELSAAFVWARTVAALLQPPPDGPLRDRRLERAGRAARSAARRELGVDDRDRPPRRRSCPSRR